MKTHLRLLIILIFTYSNAQVKSGEVVYGVTVTENKESNLEKMMLSMNANYYSITKEFEFMLLFNKSKASFSEVHKLYSDEQAVKFGQLKVGVGGSFLIKNDSVYNEGASLGIGEYIKRKPLSKNWTLSTETKLIDNYVCYKATIEHIVIYKDKTFKHPITAWYCPQIPFSFGPLGYGGLPGLILELQTKDAVFGVKKIQLSDTTIEIKDLKKFKIFEEEELNTLIRRKNGEE